VAFGLGYAPYYYGYSGYPYCSYPYYAYCQAAPAYYPPY
jgi:hypothetical protein